MGEKENFYCTDVLIVGGGSAGLWAANRLTQLNPDATITIVDKGPKDWGGLMKMAGGDFEAVFPHEAVDDWVKELVYYFDGLCDQEQMKIFLQQSYERMKDYQKYGYTFLKNEDHSYKSVPQRGLKHIKLYPAKEKGRGGESMVQGLNKQLQDKNVTRIGRVFITDLLQENSRICGAVGFDTINGDFYQFQAKVVLLATGVGGWKTSYGKNTPTGEGVQLAFEAGATLKNFEFCRVWNMPRYFGWEGQTTLMPLGGRFVNNKDEEFMNVYSPILHSNTDPHFTTIAMAMETRAGRGPIYFDVSRIKPENLELVKPQNGWQLLNYQKLTSLGMDMFSTKTEWVPQMTISYGGVDADAYGMTNVEGLYAAGTARSIEPGVYAGGFALMTTAVTGYLAGEGIAKYLNEDRGVIELDKEKVQKLKKSIYAPLEGEGLHPKQVLTKIQKVMFPYDVSIIKSEQSLQRALEQIQEIQKNSIPKMTASDPHYLMKLKEVKAIAFVSQLYLEASLERRETRAGHYREDYPQRDEKMLAWLTIKAKDNQSYQFNWKAVPVSQYTHPVEKFYSDNFDFREK